MHTVQVMLVTAEADESVENVQAGVEATLEEGSDGAWFDWFGEGAFGNGLAGRWSGEYGVDVLRYSDDPAKAEELIEKMLEIRTARLESAQKALIEEDYDIRKESYSEEFDLTAYHALTVARIVAGEWTADSGIYDLETWTTRLSYFRQRVAENPAEQYLVVVDFHF